MNTQDFKRKLTAVFSADVAGYSRLMGEDETATVKTLETYKQVMFSLIKQHRGRVIDSPGDNLLAEFASVVDAVQCAVAVQKELQARNAELPENRKMEFRIGINLGDVIEERERIYGDGVNIAARLEALADPGGICVSKTAFDHIESKLPLGYRYIGEQTVKNIARPVGAYKVLMEPRVLTEAEAEKPLAGKAKSTRRKPYAVAFAAALVMLIAAAVLWQFILRPSAPSLEKADPKEMAFPLPDKPSIAVLPFVNMSDDPKQEFFCDGMTEEIITALSRNPQILVVARNSTFVYKGKPVKIKQVSEELGVRYVLEGSIQRERDRIRVMAQLIDALSGYHVWAQRYDRPFKDILALQDEITIKIMSSLNVELKASDHARVMGKGAKNLDAYLKAIEARERVFRGTKEDNAVAKKLAEEAIALDPEYPRAYPLLAGTHMMDIRLGTTKSAKESLARAIELTKKGISLDELDGKPHAFLSRLYGIARQYEEGFSEAERALALDPNSPETSFQVGVFLMYAGKTEEAIQLFQKALRLNPFPPVAYHQFLSDAFRIAGRNDEAIAAAKQAVQRGPKSTLSHIALAAAFSAAGRNEEGRVAAAEVLKLNPNFSLEAYVKTVPIKDRSELNRLMDALRKAGLPDKPPLPLPDKPSIAVLPFVNMSDDKSQEFFSDGLTEEIITALSKIPKLFVIARNSSFVYKGKPVNVQQLSRELGVKYVLEGSVRRSGDQLRITAQLIDATTGNHLWAERYDREMKDIFAIQDELTMKILTSFTQLTETQYWQMRGRYPSNPQAYLKLLEGMAYNYEVKFGDAMKSFEEALRLDPNFPPTYVWIAWIHMFNVWFGPSATRGQSLEKALEFAGKAKALDDQYWGGPAALGHAYLLKRDYDKALFEGKLATELAPNSSLAASHFGWTLRSVRRYEEAMKEYERALRLDPFNSYTVTQMGTTYFMMRKFEESISTCKKAVEKNPRDLAAYITLAMAYSSLGKMEEAHEAVSQVLKLSPNFSLEHFAKAQPYKYEEDRVFMLEALRKAGLK
jgi:adenylate cyclase